MNIVITGSIAFDYLMSFPGDFLEHIKPDRLNKLSLSFLVDEMRKQYGGCAPNIAFNLALLGEHPIVMGTAGQDFGDYRAWLEAHGVDTSGVKIIPDVFTASFFVNTDRQQNQIASFYTGAMAYARELSFYDVTTPVDMTIVSPNDPQAMQKYPAECKVLGIPYIYDPSQQIVRLDGTALREGVEGADILIVNDYEYELLKDRTGMGDDDIRAVVTRAVIVTRGEQGSVIWADGDEVVVPVVPPQQVLDPTGVGDAYRAGLIKGLALGLPWRLCGQIGALAATYVLETHGPQTHSYTLAAFGERYKRAFGEDEFTGIIRA
ncbi:MAG TPA: carbohydrate kinase family protein [Anaerolineae bacterium]|nr:carbohydrate kinase family protein [Anaerolineae bacterium]HQH38855.1 carbohydrate kinase family protein [Anaerolineae bacterium]